MRDVSQKVFQMPYGGMGRANVAPVITDLFKGRYSIETLYTTITCNTQVDLKVMLKALDFQDTMIAYVFNELYEKGICELKYKAMTITDLEWTKSSGVYNPTRESY